MFGLFQKKKTEVEPIVAMADGVIVKKEDLSDPVFAQGLMGETMAFTYEGDEVTICAPTSGTLTVVFPTGHAFGITRKDGVEVLVHIGIETVNANGEGFTLLKKQDEPVSAGEAVVKVDLKSLREKYDTSTMLVITNANGQDLHFKTEGTVKKGDSVIA